MVLPDGLAGELQLGGSPTQFRYLQGSGEAGPSSGGGDDAQELAEVLASMKDVLEVCVCVCSHFYTHL